MMDKVKFNAHRYEKMLYRRCGRSGILLPVISLGLWHNFGGVDDFQTAKKIIFRAFDLGITHFDLANNYGPPPGSAEANFGKIIKNELKSYRDELIISTKAGYLMWDGPYGEWGSKKYLVASLDQSLKRMNLDYVDIFYHHRPDPQTPLEETMGTLDLVIKQGKALYAGISNYDAEKTKEAFSILKNYGTTLLIHQPKYNMLNRWVELDLLSTLWDLGVGCISFSPLAQGILTTRYFNGIPKDSRAGKKHGFLKKEEVTEEVMNKVKRLAKIAEQRGQTISQLALAWNLRYKTVTSVLIGASSVKQLEENVKTIENLEISEHELEQIDDILKS
ncbi:L-glyceraldehyde 3-phosphate reductase [Melioribacteraceae bacterium 4301-Me]|uniref:L-glyceraldehyde 3-phosphate reductase n=1 Tax=Pyranulibacter aquaticus TaxID=3163344 RepID=UPI00359B0894